AGAASIAVHVEECLHLNRCINDIKSRGLKASVAINPSTSAMYLSEFIQDIDDVLVMTVNPGYGGQMFIFLVIDKIKQIRKMIAQTGKGITISVDGGINTDTARRVIEAGADVLIAGNFIFGSSDYKKAISELRGTGL
ncbi:MAG TPA: ribulose-phosphate 3-epimerase, partial [Clostridia bacterium]|nr:ribulose-phosphate 3-epimerase [Clostridia bacterium]